MKIAHLISTACACALAVGAAPLSARTIFSAESGTINESGPGYGTLMETINQAGLYSHYIPEVTDFDAYIASNPLHTLIFSGNEWFGNSGTTTAMVTYDLGKVRPFSAIALWNEESSGIGLLDLLTSVDGISFTPLASGLMPTDHPYADYLPDVYELSATARYVRFSMSECPQPIVGSFAACAIGEVAFANGIPEPATWTMLIGGFGLTGLAVRRRRAGTVIA